MLKKAFTIVLALLFVVGVTAQIMPRASAMPIGSNGAAPGRCEMMLSGHSADQSGDESPGHDTHKQSGFHFVNCLGCAVSVHLPELEILAAVEWTAVRNPARSPLLRGVSVEPEISPPILFV
jgi:hypothetical protein